MHQVTNIYVLSFEYTSCGEWHNLRAEDVLPYDTTTALYKEYTAEREKHIVFSLRCVSWLPN